MMPRKSRLLRHFMTINATTRVVYLKPKNRGGD
jgi:hypothetical protein